MTTWLRGNFIQSARERFHSAKLLPWMLSYVLLIEITFQFLLKTWSEVLEIVLFVAILAVFLALKLAAEGPKGVLHILTGTWTQRLAAVFVLALMLSFLWGDHSTRSILALIRLPTYLVIIAMVVDAVREEKRIPSFAWTILGGSAIIFTLVLVEFYFGSDAVGLKCADVEKCMTYKPEGWHWEGLLDSSVDVEEFSESRGSLEATVIADAYGISRLGMFAILAYVLGIGLIITSRRWPSRLIAVGLLTIIIFGAFVSGSRSGTFAILIVLAAFIALSAVSPPRVVVPLTASGIAVLAAAFLASQVLPTGITSFDRIFPQLLGSGSSRGSAIDAPPPGVKFGVARIRDEEAEKRVGETIIAYLVYDDPANPWHWQRANAQSDDASKPNHATWTDVEDALSYDYTLTGGDWGKFLRGYVYYEKDGGIYWAQTPAIGPIRKGLGAPPPVSAGGVGVSSDEWRTRNWKLALEIFADDPVGGSGFRTFQAEARERFPDTLTVGAHNGYLQILAEAGLIGALPLLAVLACALWMMWRLAPGASAEATLWRNAFLSAFAVLLLINLVDTHSSDRYFWVVLSFAAVTEIWKRQRDSRPRERLGNGQREPGCASE